MTSLTLLQYGKYVSKIQHIKICNIHKLWVSLQPVTWLNTNVWHMYSWFINSVILNTRENNYLITWFGIQDLLLPEPLEVMGWKNLDFAASLNLFVSGLLLLLFPFFHLLPLNFVFVANLDIFFTFVPILRLTSDSTCWKVCFLWM